MNELETIGIEQEKKIGFGLVNNDVIKGKQHVDLEEFLKGTISGEEVVKYVCDRLDEKYGRN